jgi:hypothetical protein
LLTARSTAIRPILDKATRPPEVISVSAPNAPDRPEPLLQAAAVVIGRTPWWVRLSLRLPLLGRFGWAWLRRHSASAGGGPGGPGGGDFGGVREPRRPRPSAPGGVVRLPDQADQAGRT